MKITIVTGPTGCGKTSNANKIAEILDCDYIIDDMPNQWTERAFYDLRHKFNVLILCQSPKDLAPFMVVGAKFVHFNTLNLGAS